MRMSMRVAAVFIAMSSLGWAAEYTKLTPAQILAEVKAGKAVIVDVREEPEWEEGHLKQALWVPLSSLEGVDAKGRAMAMKDLPKDKAIYLHCKSGVRCMKAATLLEKDGVKAQAVKTPYPTLEKTFGRAMTPAKQP